MTAKASKLVFLEAIASAIINGNDIAAMGFIMQEVDKPSYISWFGAISFDHLEQMDDDLRETLNAISREVNVPNSPS